MNESRIENMHGGYGTSKTLRKLFGKSNNNGDKYQETLQLFK
jgi:hypothetical protein